MGGWTEGAGRERGSGGGNGTARFLSAAARAGGGGDGSGSSKLAQVAVVVPRADDDLTQPIEHEWIDVGDGAGIIEGTQPLLLLAHVAVVAARVVPNFISGDGVCVHRKIVRICVCLRVY